MKSINKKSFPFLILLIIHSTFLLFTFYKMKNKRKTLFILLLSNIGFAYIFEYFIFNIFKAYQYKPKVLKNRFLDNIFGAFLSQAVFLPFTSIFISAFGYGWKVKVIFTLYFSIIERIFIKLKIFNNKTWRTTYTIIFIPIYFKISDFWYKKLINANGIIQSLSLFLMTWVSGITIINMSAVIRKFRFGKGLYSSWKEHFIFATLYWFVQSLLSSWSIANNSIWLGKFRTFLLMKLFDLFIVKWWKVKICWNRFLFHNGLQIFMIFFTSMFKKWIYSEQYYDKKD